MQAVADGHDTPVKVVKVLAAGLTVGWGRQSGRAAARTVVLPNTSRQMTTVAVRPTRLIEP